MPTSIGQACDALEDAGRQTSVMVDCSHGNSGKSHDKQPEVVRNVAAQIASGSKQVFGVMIESHLVAGAQGFKPGSTDRRTLRYGQSITDACIGWDDVEGVADRTGQMRCASAARRAERPPSRRLGAPASSARRRTAAR